MIITTNESKNNNFGYEMKNQAARVTWKLKNSIIEHSTFGKVNQYVLVEDDNSIEITEIHAVNFTHKPACKAPTDMYDYIRIEWNY